MKYLYLILCLLTISCVSNNQNNENNQVILDEVSSSEIQDLIISDENTNIEIIDTVDFGSIGENETHNKQVTITNKLNSSLQLDLSDLQAKINETQRFKININSCPTILKVNKSCIINISLSYVNNEDYTQPISSKITTNNANPNYGKIVLIGAKKSPTLSVNTITTSQLGYIYSLTDKVRYYLTNTGTQAQTLVNDIPTEFTIIQNTCNPILKPSKTCLIELQPNRNNLTNVSEFQKTITINSAIKQIKTTNIPTSVTQDLKICNDKSIQINNACINLASYYNTQCDCYQNIPYTATQTSFVMDGTLNTGIGYQKLDLYLPAIPNGKMVVYTHPMGENKEIDTDYEIALKNEALLRGYSFITVEFRHPILESDEANSTTNQWDIINALKFARLNLKAFHLSDVDNIYSFSYSKGSLILANITTNSSQMSDLFGRIGIKKMFILDGQVTYNFTSYYQNFIDKNSIKINSFISVSALSYFTNLNNLAKASFGFKLTSDLNVLDSLRQVPSETKLISTSKLPDIFFAYNHANKNRLLKSNEILSTSGSFNLVESDYLLHNPQSATAFCGSYSQIKSCGTSDNLQNNLNIPNVFNFFEN
jgi:hypothetical protein